MGTMKSKNTIEVNGRRYDATTGALLGPASAPGLPDKFAGNSFFRERKKTAPSSEKINVRVVTKPQSVVTKAVSIPVKKPSKKVPVAPVATETTTLHVHATRATNHAKAHAPSATPASSSRQQLIERRKKQRSINHAQAHAPQTTAPHEVRKPSEAYRKHKLMGLHSPVNHTKARATQDSLTLVRAAVQRPAPSMRKQASPKGVLRRSMPSLITVKSSVQAVDETRLARAHSTSRSPLIAHHAHLTKAAVQPIVTPLAVQPIPVKPEGEVPNTAPAPQPSNKPDTPTDIFEHALANASHYADLGAHRAKRKQQARRRVTSLAAGLLALLVIAGFATYQNTPGLQFKVASLRAGISTGMPNFEAAGFAYNGVHAANGQLTIGFDNVSGNYQLTQTNTNLSDSDMIASISPADSHPTYQTLYTAGTTVYRLDSTSATWVANGKWYTIHGNGTLTDPQVESLVHNI